MKVLVTGGTGFIGTHVISALLKMNCEVVATSAPWNNAPGKPWFPHVTYQEYDFLSTVPGENLYRRFGEPDVVIHLAWKGLSDYRSAVHEQQVPAHAGFI